MTKEKIQELIQKYLRGAATEEETRLLDQWYHTFDPEELTVHLPAEKGEDESKLQSKMWQRLQSSLHPLPEARSVKVRRSIYRYAMAAAILAAILLTGVYIFKSDNSTDPLSKGIPMPTTTSVEILPGSNKAVLTLADGSSIVLDTARKGALAQQGATKISLLSDGQLTYKAQGGQSVYYNTLSTPKGGQYQITLPDGTQAWLNASSSIRFPTNFQGKERGVEVTGEVYFEVAQQLNMPFKVRFKGNEVEVLGTHFNINAYDDENVSKTTLLEGRIQVRFQGKQHELKPGMQAQSAPGSFSILPTVDTEATVAWKDGYFHFASADIESLMRQAARWYNIEVDYTMHKPSDRFTGRIPRSVNLSEFLNILKYSDVPFKIQNRKITFMP